MLHGMLLIVHGYTLSRLSFLFHHTSHHRQAFAILEERFSCSLRHRKQFIKAELVNVVRAILAADASSSSPSSDDGASSVSDSPDEATASANHGSDQEGQQQVSDQDNEQSESSSSLSDDGGEQADVAMMPRPNARKTSARRALAKAKVKRAVRRAKTSGDVSGGGSSSSSEKSSSSSDSDLGSVASGGSGGSRGRRRKKPAKRKTTKKASSGGASSSSPSSSGEYLSSDAAAEKANEKDTRREGSGKYTKNKSAAEDDGGSALVDSDEGGEQEEASKGDVASTIVKAVVQEELDVRKHIVFKALLSTQSSAWLWSRPVFCFWTLVCGSSFCLALCVVYFVLIPPLPPLFVNTKIILFACLSNRMRARRRLGRGSKPQRSVSDNWTRSA